MNQLVNMFRLLLLAACLVGSLAVRDFTGYKVLTLTPSSPDVSSIKFLQSLESEFDVWREPSGADPSTDVMVPRMAVRPLRTKMEGMGFNVRTKIDDVQSLINQQVKSTAGFDYQDYNTMEEIQQWMIDFSAANSELVEIEQIGTTYEGRVISKLRISTDLSDTTKPIFFMIGGTHSREWITPATMINFAKYLVENRGKADDLLSLMEFNIVPVFNQDGYVHTWLGDRMWRKTRRPNEGSPCVGTDMNRNWDSHWGTGGSSPFPCSDLYMGPSPGSEVEVRSMMDHVLAIRDRVKVFMDVHAFYQFWMYPYGYSDSLGPAEEEELYAASSKAVQAIYETHGKSYEFGTIADVIYVASGSSSDWSYDEAGIVHSYALELRDTGEYGFLLPASQIQPAFEEFYAGCEATVHYLRDNDKL